MYQQIYNNYGQSPNQQHQQNMHHHEDSTSDHSIKTESTCSNNNNTMYYDNNTNQNSSQSNNNLTLQYPAGGYMRYQFDPSSYDQPQQPNQQQQQQHYNRNDSLHSFNGFQSMNSPQDMVASLTSNTTSIYNPINTSSQGPSTTITATVLPPLNTTPIIMAPLQHHPTTSHQTYLLAQKKPLKGSPRPSRERAPWTPEEDNLLKLAVQLYGDKTEKWAKIAACVPGRTNKNCRKRWFHSLDPSLRKGAWTEEEDQLLREGVSKYPNQWSKIADMLPGRTDDQCAKRWRESLDPSIDRSEWTSAEDVLLMEKYEEYGSQWQKIAFFFDGRPGLHCRNRWRKLQRMVQLKKDKEVNLNQPFFNTLAEDRFHELQPIHIQPQSNNAASSSGGSSSNQASIQHTNIQQQQHNPNPIQHHTNIQQHSNDIQNNNNNHSPHSFQHLTSLLQAQQQQQDTSILAQYQNEDYEDYTTNPTDIKPFGCDVPGCYAVFALSTGLFYHMKNMHPHLQGVDKPYRCAMTNCFKKYKNINGLQYHIKDAKGTTGHNHLVNNEDDRPFRCMIGTCKKAYRTASGFRYHQQNGHHIGAVALSVEQQQQFRMKREKWE